MSSSRTLVIVLLGGAACDGGAVSVPSLDAGVPNDAGELQPPLRSAVTIDPTTGDIEVRVFDAATSEELVSVRFERATARLHWRAGSDTWTDPESVDRSDSADPSFAEALEGAAIVALLASEPGHLRRPGWSHAPSDCDAFQFRGDHKCSVPASLGLLLLIPCLGCVPTQQCEDHDDCYFSIPDDVCRIANPRNQSKFACDDRFGSDVAGICNRLCGWLYQRGTRFGGGRGWNPANPCDDHDTQSTNLGTNYCGGFAEPRCCQQTLRDGTCDVNGVATAAFPPDCACHYCQSHFLLITDLSPMEGDAVGSTTVAISGLGFDLPTTGEDPVSVSVGGRPATIVVHRSTTELVVRTPPQDPMSTVDAVDITITVDKGRDAPDRFDTFTCSACFKYTDSSCVTLVDDVHIPEIWGPSRGTYFLADDERVYWFDTECAGGRCGSLRSHPKVPDDQNEVTIIASGVQSSGIAYDATHLYWAGDRWVDTTSVARGVFSIPKTGAGPPTLLAGRGGGSSHAIAEESAFIYWMEDGPVIRRVPKAGGPAVEIGNGRFAFDAHDDSYFYSVSLARMPLDGSQIDVLGSVTSTNAGTFCLAVDETHLYWAHTEIDGLIAKIPKDGGSVTTLATATAAYCLAIDDTFVYFAGGRTTGDPIDARGILRVPKDGGAAEYAARCPPSSPGAIFSPRNRLVVDVTGIYVIDADAHRIVFAPKPPR